MTKQERQLKVRLYTITFRDGTVSTFKSCKRDWVGDAIGHNQSQTWQNITDVSEVDI